MGRAAWTLGEGPLVAFAGGFGRELARLGHPAGVVKYHLVLMGQLNRWLLAQGLGAGDVTRAVAERFLAFRRAGGQRRVPTLVSLVPLLGYLSELGVVVPESRVQTGRDELLARYRGHLINDRGLAASTVLRYERFARRFLAQRAAPGSVQLGIEGLTSADVHAFLLEAGSRLTVESAKREAADLRALLRFVFLEGMVATDLGAAMPPVAVWRGARLPETLTVRQVDALLEGCDRATPSGRRDYAILVLLARLGLRSGEVAALQLSDIDWRAGAIVVAGKARRRDRLPLPVEVGEALAAYLSADRPVCAHRSVILTRYAPPRPIHPSSITNVVYRACRRAGVDRVGGHRLRHALASELLRRGGDLTEIAQVLRHSDLGTTAGYAKLDRAALGTVAQPWPGAVQ